MNTEDKEKLIEAILKTVPPIFSRHSTKIQFADWQGMSNQYNHTVYELYQNDLLTYEEYASLLRTP